VLIGPRVSQGGSQLQIVTSIDTRVQRMETNIEKRIDDLNQSMLSVSSRVRTLENRSNELGGLLLSPLLVLNR
jgi:hypothetical protein